MTSTTVDLNQETFYSHPDLRGAALTFRRYAMTDPDVEYDVICQSDDCPHDTEWCYVAVDVEPEEDRTWAYVVMVGDDQRHLVETQELTAIDEEEFCHGCGAIGCGF